MFKIVNIIEEGKLGGPQIYIMRVAGGLQGHVETLIIMPKENSEAFRELCDTLGVSYKTFWISRITKEWKVALRYLLFFPFEIAGLARFFWKNKYDLVYACGGSWQYKGVIAGKLAGRKVLWHLNDTSMPWVFLQLFHALSRYADGYIFASERSKEYYGSLVKKDKPQFVIPAPVDTQKFDPARSYCGDEALIKQWQGKIVIGTIANVNPIKGLDVFIRAAAALNKQFDDLFFIVVGQTYANQQRYFNRLKQLCDCLLVGNVEFVGGRRDVRPLLQRFDIYVCSSQAESSPMAVWEAMGMEKPVVSTDVGDVSIYVRNGHCGFIVDVGDWEVLSEKLASLVVDEDLRRMFGYRGREIAIKKLDVDLCVQRHLNAYKQMLHDYRIEG